MYIDELKALLDKTTPGPWINDVEIDGYRAGKYTVVKAGDGFNRKRVVTVDQTRPHHDKQAEDNIKFIATARQVVPDLIRRIESSLELIYRFGQIDGDHHKTWVIDQIVRALLDEDYDEWIDKYTGDPKDEDNYYLWNTGIAP